jgi:hypothetical protein
MSGIPRNISLNCCAPANSSRRIMGVQRCANTSQATATGQNWPNPDPIVKRLAEHHLHYKFTFYTIDRSRSFGTVSQARGQSRAIVCTEASVQ